MSRGAGYRLCWIFQLEAVVAVDQLLQYLQIRLGLLPTSSVAIFGAETNFASLRTQVRASGAKPLEINTTEHELSHQILRRFGVQQIVWNGPDLTARDLGEPWCLENPGFVMSWIASREYDYWQNATDPLQYEAEGRDWSALPRISNGLPPPLQQEIIDISRNQGRRILRNGYVEAVGSAMYLAPRFWELTGGDPSKARQLAIESEQQPSRVERIVFAAAPFSTDEGECGRIQEAVRSSLYSRDVS